MVSYTFFKGIHSQSIQPKHNQNEVQNEAKQSNQEHIPIQDIDGNNPQMMMLPNQKIDNLLPRQERPYMMVEEQQQWEEQQQQQYQLPYQQQQQKDMLPQQANGRTLKGQQNP